SRAKRSLGLRAHLRAVRHGSLEAPVRRGLSADVLDHELHGALSAARKLADSEAAGAVDAADTDEGGNQVDLSVRVGYRVLVGSDRAVLDRSRLRLSGGRSGHGRSGDRSS